MPIHKKKYRITPRNSHGFPVVSLRLLCSKNPKNRIMNESKILNRDLCKEIKYSERDIVLYLEKKLKKSLCGDCFSESPWGRDENKQLYISIFGIDDRRFGIKHLV